MTHPSPNDPNFGLPPVWGDAIRKQDPGVIGKVLSKFDPLGPGALLLVIEHPWPTAWDAWWPCFDPLDDLMETGRLVAHALHFRGPTVADAMMSALPASEGSSLRDQVWEEGFLVAVAMGWSADIHDYQVRGVDLAAEDNAALAEALALEPFDSDLVARLWPTLAPSNVPTVFAEAIKNHRLEWAQAAWEMAPDTMACARQGIRHAFDLATESWAPRLFDRLTGATATPDEQWLNRNALVTALGVCAAACQHAWVERCCAKLDPDTAFRVLYTASLGTNPTMTAWAKERLWPQVSSLSLRADMVRHTLNHGAAADLADMWTPGFPPFLQMEWLHTVVGCRTPMSGDRVAALMATLKAKIEWDTLARWSPSNQDYPLGGEPIADSVWDDLATHHVPEAVRQAWVTSWPDRLPLATARVEAERRCGQATVPGNSLPRASRHRV